jgi:hypothetical protein
MPLTRSKKQEEKVRPTMFDNPEKQYQADLERRASLSSQERAMREREREIADPAHRHLVVYPDGSVGEFLLFPGGGKVWHESSFVPEDPADPHSKWHTITWNEAEPFQWLSDGERGLLIEQPSGVWWLTYGRYLASIVTEMEQAGIALSVGSIRQYTAQHHPGYKLGMFDKDIQKFLESK